MTRQEMAELRARLLAAARASMTKAASCAGKEGHASRANAERAIRPRLKREVAAYRCGLCGLWHVGSQGGRRRTDKAKRRWLRRRQLV